MRVGCLVVERPERRHCSARVQVDPRDVLLRLAERRDDVERVRALIEEAVGPVVEVVATLLQELRDALHDPETGRASGCVCPSTWLYAGFASASQWWVKLVDRGTDDARFRVALGVPKQSRDALVRRVVPRAPLEEFGALHGAERAALLDVLLLALEEEHAQRFRSSCGARGT